MGRGVGGGIKANEGRREKGDDRGVCILRLKSVRRCYDFLLTQLDRLGDLFSLYNDNDERY